MMRSAIEAFGLQPTQVYDTYWHFAANRQDVYWHRLERRNSPSVDDDIIKSHRFTNSYRVLDRVSQYLIANVQRGPNARENVLDQVFRTLLFKTFNKIETWEELERTFGPIDLNSFSFRHAGNALEELRANGRPIYSAAYIMPSPKLGHARKHENHLALLERLFVTDGGGGLLESNSLRQAYEILSTLPGIGRFLAFQYAIDLGYLDELAFNESEYVVAGPGARDGIAKCFENWRDFELEETINAVHLVQDEEFKSRGIEFRGLPNRRLQPVDCQNLFCEISKYARVAHPEILGADGRIRIKQRYKPSSAALPEPVFPAHWEVPNRLSGVAA